jgi:hypothetical protein
LDVVTEVPRTLGGRAHDASPCRVSPL